MEYLDAGKNVATINLYILLSYIQLSRIYTEDGFLRNRVNRKHTKMCIFSYLFERKIKVK